MKNSNHHPSIDNIAAATMFFSCYFQTNKQTKTNEKKWNSIIYFYTGKEKRKEKKTFSASSSSSSS